jgi:GTP-binding protein Era
MVQAAWDSLIQADVVLWVLDAVAGVTDEDREIGERLAPVSPRTIQVLNKIDRIQKGRLLPLIEQCSKLLPDTTIVPVSARTREGLDILIAEILKLLPPGTVLYPPDEITNQAKRFFVAEAIREQIFLLTHQEVPYTCGVVVEKFEEKREKNLVLIFATVLVEREPHKAILIGRQGAKLKEIGTRSRREIENLLRAKVYLELFVKSKEGWTDNPEVLAEMGI